MCNLTPQQIDAEVGYLLSLVPAESDMTGRVMLKNGEWEEERIIAYVESRLRYMDTYILSKYKTYNRDVAFKRLYQFATDFRESPSEGLDMFGFTVNGLMPDFIRNIVLSACEPVKQQADGSTVIVLRDPRVVRDPRARAHAGSGTHAVAV